MGMPAAVGNGHGRGRQRPNFVVIVADDMGFSDPGCYGGEVRTPNLDGLARGGIRFSQAYSTARCWPSRTCLLTGYYAQQVRMDPPEGRLPAWARVLPDYLKPAGYRCLHAGKWHLMGAPKVVADGGFDRSYVIHDHDRYFCPQKHELDDRPLAAIQPGSDFYLTTHIADRAIGFLDQHAASHGSDPFCLFLAFTSPHFPLHAPAADIERYRQVYLEGWDRIRERRWRRMRRMGLVRCALPPAGPEIVPPWNLSPEDLARMIGPGEAARAVPWETLSDEQRRFQATKMAIHAAMVDRMDREIGRVIGKLEAMGARDDTVVLFVSDNGASAEQIIRGDKHDAAAAPGSAKSYLCLGPGWSTAANTPFRLHKSWVHEGGISSPLIVNWPSGIAARGELRHAPCHFVDVIPTLADLAGVTIQPHHGGRTAPPLPGVSLVPAFGEDRAIERDCLYFHHIGNRALRVGDWKLVAAAQGPWELYDLETDRSEMRNLAARYPDRVAEMAARWQRLEDTFRSQAGQSGQQ
jgi:arylsulfatase